MWQLLPLFAFAFSLRAYVNRGAAQATPDEKVYAVYAHTWRPGKTYTEMVAAFLNKPELEVPPSRFLFFALSALVTWGKKSWVECFNPLTWLSVVAGALATPLVYLITQDWRASLLVGTSSLSIMLSRRALQDAFAALPVLMGVWAIGMQNDYLLAAAVAMTLTTREAMLLYLPALFISWGLHSGGWFVGGIAVVAGCLLAMASFYVVGGRWLLPVFYKLGQSTNYVRRFQSGMPHRILVDMMLVSPVAMVAGIIAIPWAPIWLTGFILVAGLTHALIRPKNLRFLLPVELGVRTLVAFLPEPWPWVALGLGVLTDLRLYFAIGGCKDPVTYNLVVRTSMYSEEK